MSLPVNECEIDVFLRAFESCTLPKERWTHAAHIFTGSCYIHTYGEAAAIDRMRTCVRRYNESVGGQNSDTSGYHETVTVFWIQLLAGLLSAHPAESRGAFAALAAARFSSDRELLTRFYSFDVPASTEARLSWVPPDLRSFEDECRS